MIKMTGYSISDLKHWAGRVERILASLGIDHYPQEFEIIDHKMMLDVETYLGMPSFYPHQSFGRDYEFNVTLYKYGLKYLPYELVINTSPCLAYLKADNDLAMQILTICHVYWHNNFFKNNHRFTKLADAEKAFEFFRSSAETIREYMHNPSIGPRAVQKCLTMAHSIRYQSEETSAKNLPPSGQNCGQNLLVFLRDNSMRAIPPWEKNVMTIAADTFRYIIPLIDTKIMNEGWASLGHYTTMEMLELPADLRFAIGRHHGGVVRFPDQPTSLNPYLIGFKIWEDIRKNRPDEFIKIMQEESDSSFLDKYLTPELLTELRLYSYAFHEENIVVSQTPEKDYQKIKDQLIKIVGVNTIPMVKVKSANYTSKNMLYLEHVFEGRNLDPTHTKKTLEAIYYFWGSPVILSTRTYKNREAYVYRFDGKTHVAGRESRIRQSLSS